MGCIVLVADIDSRLFQMIEQGACFPLVMLPVAARRIALSYKIVFEIMNGGDVFEFKRVNGVVVIGNPNKTAVVLFELVEDDLPIVHNVKMLKELLLCTCLVNARNYDILEILGGKFADDVVAVAPGNDKVIWELAILVPSHQTEKQLISLYFLGAAVVWQHNERFLVFLGVLHLGVMHLKGGRV